MLLPKPTIISCIRLVPSSNYRLKVLTNYSYEAEIKVNENDFEPLQTIGSDILVNNLNVGDTFQVRLRNVDGDNYSDWYVFNEIFIDSLYSNYTQFSPKPDNPNFYDNDFDLYNALNNEVIQKKGIDCIYLPKKFQKFDLILGEDVLTKFEDSYKMKMYLRSATGFDGSGDMFGKFGLSVEDIANLEVNISEFHRVTNDTVPVEGDLIYIIMGNFLMEIFHVEDEDPYFTLGKTSEYIFSTRKYDYSHEQMETDIEDIDKVKEFISTDIESENDLIEDDINDILNIANPNEFGNR